MTWRHGAAPGALALSLLSGCCWNALSRQAETLVVVVPSRHDGHVGAVVVSDGTNRQVLDQAYATARIRAGKLHRTSLTAGDIDKIFGVASEALPKQARTFVLYFDLGTEGLTQESNRQLDDVLDEVANRPAAEIIVAGHTDRMGTPANNDALSLKRAQHLRERVIQRGAAPAIVHAIGMGEREPIVDTPDGVAEARNRRVEIIVR